MKTNITIILLLLPLLIFGQTRKQKRKAKAQKLALVQYYSSYSLMPDSAASPYLYYQVFDWIGTRYKYAGSSKKGIDCSGFVSEMYRNVYCINLSGGSTDIWTKVNPVEKADLKEGDILFFKIRKGQISHVGIFLGNNKFAHASVKTGVMINDLDEDYYKKCFFKGGRIP